MAEKNLTKTFLSGSNLGIAGLILLFIFFSLPAQGFRHYSSDVRNGLDLLELGRLEEAEAALQRARFKSPEDPKISYNLGNVLYRRRKYSEAIREFERAATGKLDENLKADALHNIGNAHFRTGSYQDSMMAYTRSLEMREDPQTRFNLEQARKLIEQQMQQQDQKQDQQQGQKQQSQDQSGNQEKGDQDQSGDGQPQGQQDQQGQQDSRDDSRQDNGRDDKQSPQDRSRSDQTDDQSGSDDSRDQSRQREAGEADDQEGDQDQEGQTGEEDSEQDQQVAQGEEDSQEQLQDTQQSESAEESDSEPSEEMTAQEPDMIHVPQEEQEAFPMPEASERARRLREEPMNPYMVERILRQLEEREKQLQLRYRNEPRTDEQHDPFFMDSRSLRDFFDRRTGRSGGSPRPESKTPDW